MIIGMVVRKGEIREKLDEKEVQIEEERNGFHFLVFSGKGGAKEGRRKGRRKDFERKGNAGIVPPDLDWVTESTFSCSTFFQLLLVSMLPLVISWRLLFSASLFSIFLLAFPYPPFVHILSLLFVIAVPYHCSEMY